jgi:hypothetical protein
VQFLKLVLTILVLTCSGVGSWRDREKQKIDEWGPTRKEGEDAEPEKQVRRQEVTTRRDEPPARRDERSIRREDDRGPRRVDDGPGRLLTLTCVSVRQHDENLKTTLFSPSNIRLQ